MAKCCHSPELAMVLFAVFVIFLPRGANVADVAILVGSQEFQMQCTQPVNNSNWCTFAVFATFPKVRNVVIYGVGNLSRNANDKSTPNAQKHVGACEAGLHKAVARTSQV